MIRLDATTRKLQIILAGAVTTNQLPVAVCYSDKTTASYLGGTQLANSNSMTAVDICAAPSASTVRDVDTINVQNADTAAATATVRYNDNGTLYTLFKASLAVGDQLTYVHGQGWSVLDSTGAVKGGGSGGGISDGDKGDITVSSSGAVWTIDDDVVTYAKIQDVSATDKLLGRSTAGAGNVEEIACTAAGRALIDDADAAAQRTTLGLSGPAFSVYQTSAQSINNSFTTVVSFDTEEYDTASCFSTSTYRFTPNVAGYYQIEIYVQFNTTLYAVGLLIAKNGTNYKTIVNTAVPYLSINGSCVVGFNGTTDYIEFRAYSASTQDTLPGATNVWAMGYFVRPL
jgi:hypothetical protein